MPIEHYDAPTRFSVPASKPCDPPYLVELETHGLTGHCTCPHFQMRMLPLIADPKGGARGAGVRCKHIVAAREFYAKELKIDAGEALDQVLRKYAKTQIADQGRPWPPPEPVD